MSSDITLKDVDFEHYYSYDNIKTQGWLDGHLPGLEAGVAYLKDKSVELFKQRKDTEAIELRKLTETMFEALRPGMIERAELHRKEHPEEIEKP